MSEMDKDSTTIKQTLACFAVYHFSMSLGAGSGFSGVAIPQLLDEEVTGFTMTKNQLSWFASIQTFAMIPTCVLGGVLGHYFGRKFSLMMIAPLFSSGFICQALARDQFLLLFGRFICGAASGLACGPTATYVSEVTTANLRTTFGSGISGSYNLGMLTIFTLGAFCHWRVLAGVSALFPVMGFVWLTFVPESPSWYIAQGRYQEAYTALVWLRGENSNTEKEMAILKEHHMQHYVYHLGKKDSSVCRKSLQKLRVFLRPDVYKPFLIIIVVSFLQQFCGMCTISYYSVVVLSSAGSSIDEYLATIIFGLMRFVSQVLGSFLLIKFPRRLLLVVSCTFVSLAMSLLATSAYLSDKYRIQDNSTATTLLLNDESADLFPSDFVRTLVGILPLISVCLAAFMYHIGLGPIPWSYMAELYPLDVRSFMSGVGNCTSNLYIFLVIKTFPSLVTTMTLAGTYWFYSSVTLLTILFTLFFLPETHGKDFVQISKEFHKKYKDDETTTAEKQLLESSA